MKPLDVDNQTPSKLPLVEAAQTAQTEEERLWHLVEAHLLGLVGAVKKFKALAAGRAAGRSPKRQADK